MNPAPAKAVALGALKDRFLANAIGMDASGFALRETVIVADAQRAAERPARGSKKTKPAESWA